MLNADTVKFYEQILGGSIYKAYVLSLKMEDEDNGVIIILVIASGSEKKLW